MTTIGRYRLFEDLSGQNAGFCQWGFCERDGHEYFIKEFLSPKYPDDSSNLSPKILERKRAACDAFYAERKLFYDTLRGCRNGNIVIVQDFFRAGTKYYAVTDKVSKAETDPGIIADLTPDRKETFLRVLTYSVSCFHNAGIVHADLKPSNILIKKTTDGFYTAKIIDFDAGYFSDRAPEEAQGDFIYYAPETFLKMNGEDVRRDEKIDIFALGILFHQYWTGALPVIGADYNYVHEAVLDGETPRFYGSIPSGLIALIKRMLARDPEDRPTAAEILRYWNSAPETPVSTGRIPVSGPAKAAPASIMFSTPDDLD